jgi:tetratricopeptide (TPR) repeat protein
MSSTNPELTRKIRQLCATGYQHYDAGDYKAALRLFYQAWLLLPKPQTDCVEAGWVLTAIGDSYFRSGQYQPGREALQSALCCPQMSQAPFIHLRLGQCLWELGLHDSARTALLCAYDIARMDIFSAEDRKYYFAIAGLLSRQTLNEPSPGISSEQHQKLFQTRGN